jgi:hypothetical protein
MYVSLVAEEVVIREGREVRFRYIYMYITEEVEDI